MPDHPVEEEEEEEDTPAHDGTRSTSAASSSRNKRLWGNRPQDALELREREQYQHTPSNAGDTEPEEEEDAVPQSFMIEATPRKPAGASSSHARREERRATRASRQSARRATASTTSTRPKLSKPPRPSEVGGPPVLAAGAADTATAFASTRPQRGLDEYQKALWSWVNVGDLDAYLQEVCVLRDRRIELAITSVGQVYAYYVGKGIYCIALSRGLNLLSAYQASTLPGHALIRPITAQSDSSSASQHFYWAALTTPWYTKTAQADYRI